MMQSDRSDKQEGIKKRPVTTVLLFYPSSERKLDVPGLRLFVYVTVPDGEKQQTDSEL